MFSVAVLSGHWFDIRKHPKVGPRAIGLALLAFGAVSTARSRDRP